MKVYIVHKGKYSDRHVEAVFSNREYAELFIAHRRDIDRYALGWCDYYSIQECTVNERLLQTVEDKVYYALTGYISDGKVFINAHTTSLNPIESRLDKENILGHRDFIVQVPDKVRYKSNGCELNITERNKKVVYDTLAQLKAEEVL